MDDRKICFIRCINDDVYAAEQDYYLSNLIVPEGFDIDVLSITDAPSMCAGYNEGMAASDAKYKIYLHQDVFIFKKDFLIRLLEIFEDPAVGMLGLVGNPVLPPRIEPWEAPRTGRVLSGVSNKLVGFGDPYDFKGAYTEVQVIDGFLMATQVDIPWREDLFGGWDMYDLSQSFEMRRAGYKVGVINQEDYWAIHDESVMHLSTYYEWLEIFRKEYEKDIVEPSKPVHSFTKPTALCVVPQGGSNDFATALAEAGYPVHIEERLLHPNEPDPRKDAVYLDERYRSSNVQAAVSQLFIPSLAVFCQKRNIPCISWIYDSPQQALYRPEALFETNHFFVFDKALYQRLVDAGLPHVTYRPLAANISRADKAVSAISSNDRLQYIHDITFVGNLYKEDSYLADYDRLSGSSAKLLQKYYRENLCRWEGVRPWPKMPQDVCPDDDSATDHGSMPSDIFYGTAIMSRKLAQLERIEVLNALARKHRVDLFTNSDASDLKSVTVHKSVNYYTDASKVFHLSRINLNITLPSIETGVPQRVFDIMAAGGFVMTNYQEEMGTLFDIGREIETFKNIDELLEKTDHYLSHDEERRKIAENGRRKVAADHDMKKIIGEIYGSVVYIP